MPHGNSISCTAINGDDGGLIHHHLVIYHDKGIGGAKVNSKFLLEEIKKIEHNALFMIVKNGFRESAGLPSIQAAISGCSDKFPQKYTNFC
jgi:hypothetical protein